MKLLKGLGVLFAVFASVPVFAQYQEHPNFGYLQQEAKHLSTHADSLNSWYQDSYNDNYNDPLTTQEFYKLWGSTLAFQQELLRNLNINFPRVEKALNIVKTQKAALMFSLQASPLYPLLLPHFGRMDSTFQRIHVLMYPIPRMKPVLTFTRCHPTGNDLFPNLQIVGTVRGVNISHVRVYFQDELVGEIDTIEKFYQGQPPYMRNRIVTIGFDEKIKKGGIVRDIRKPLLCRIEAEDADGQTDDAVLSAR